MSTLTLTGGAGGLTLNADGTISIRIEYRLAFGIQLPPETVIVVEDVVRPSDQKTDALQGEWAKLAENWATRKPE